MRQSRFVVAMGAVSLAIGGGCEAGKPAAESATTEATVKGKVTVLGKPAIKGNVTFDPTNINRPGARIRTTEIKADGSYELTTLVGPNSVSVNVPKPSRPTPGMSPEFGHVVTPGENTLDIPLPKAED